MAHIAKITVYPIKSLDGVEVNQGKVLQSGSLQYDRQYAIFDERGKVVNAKRYVRIHLIRAKFDLENDIVSLSVTGKDVEDRFHLQTDRKALETWLSDFFNFHVQVRENLTVGFPDDTLSPAPTVISTATIQEVASWYENMTEEQMRHRLRTTLEIDGVPAFWEDRLFSDKKDETIPFIVGQVRFLGVNPCQRCIVPTRDIYTGEQTSDFQKEFINKRQETLPNWVAKSRFNHFYKLSVNTKLADETENLKMENNFIRIKDEVRLL